MVIGNGLVASTFSSYKDLDEYTIFASGVSNSKTSTETDFSREFNMLRTSLEKYANTTFVYFSTCSIDDPDVQQSSYVKHKINMEETIRTHSNNYRIFRLSNLAGQANNPYTVLNFFYLHIANHKSFELWKNSHRNILDVTDMFMTVDYILKNNLGFNQTLNVANVESYPVPYIIECIEAFTSKKAIFTERERGNKLEIDVTDVTPIFNSLGITFGKDYLRNLLEKYYSGK